MCFLICYYWWLFLIKSSFANHTALDNTWSHLDLPWVLTWNESEEKDVSWEGEWWEHENVVTTESAARSEYSASLLCLLGCEEPACFMNSSCSWIWVKHAIIQKINVAISHSSSPVQVLEQTACLRELLRVWIGPNIVLVYVLLWMPQKMPTNLWLRAAQIFYYIIIF